jgi:hypothetical protein
VERQVVIVVTVAEAGLIRSMILELAQKQRISTPCSKYAMVRPSAELIGLPVCRYVRCFKCLSASISQKAII